MDGAEMIVKALYHQSKCLWVLSRMIVHHAEIVSGHYVERHVFEERRRWSAKRLRRAKLEDAFDDLRSLSGIMRDEIEEV